MPPGAHRDVSNEIARASLLSAQMVTAPRDWRTEIHMRNLGAFAERRGARVAPGIVERGSGRAGPPPGVMRNCPNLLRHPPFRKRRTCQPLHLCQIPTSSCLVWSQRVRGQRRNGFTVVLNTFKRPELMRRAVRGQSSRLLLTVLVPKCSADISSLTRTRKHFFCRRVCVSLGIYSCANLTQVKHYSQCEGVEMIRVVWSEQTPPPTLDEDPDAFGPRPTIVRASTSMGGPDKLPHRQLARRF